MTIAPCQDPIARRRLGIAKERCEEAAWAMDELGKRYRGAAAVNAALSSSLGTPVPLALYRLPWLRWLEDRIYSLIAAVRARLPGVRPYCQRYPERCRERD